MKTIYFDMDGTIADLYGVEDWFGKLINEDATPYAEAKDLNNMEELARELNRLASKGYKVGIVTWLSKGATREYDKAVRQAKREWLKAHLPTVRLDEIHMVKYGTPKSRVVKDREGMLFDDEANNRKEWKGQAFDVQNILEILRGM